MSLARTVHSTAPIRICDNGGWTDTWVARYGKVFNIAVSPAVSVRIDAYPRGTREETIVINAENFGTRYGVTLNAGSWGPHPLLEAAIRRCPPPADLDVEITIRSDAPPGASTGTSAAVVVALLGALDGLSGRARGPAEIAREAHAVETEDLGRQCGVQDQLCSAFGGINFIDIVDYPRSVVTPLVVDDHVLSELGRRLVLVYAGRPHHSSDVHEGVMRDLATRGPDYRPLELLRQAAARARDALLTGDLEELGRSMQDNTWAQAELQAELVSAEAWRIIENARVHGACGWKVNGAGGNGGSLTLLGSADDTARAAMIRDIVQDNPIVQIIPITLSAEGLRVR